MNFKDYLKESAQKIDEELDKILSDFLNGTKETDIKLLPFALGFINACKNGKRIRGVLVRLGNEIAGGKESVEVYRASCAFEIMQTAILAHDDIIDQSEMRRGRPSLYKSIGTNQAITLADIGFFLANSLIENSKVFNFFNRAMIRTGLGQLLDIGKCKTAKTYELKTAWYTFIAPLCVGAILAGADQKKLEILEQFGKTLGVAYQIQDDILDEGKQALSQKVLEYSLEAKKMIPEITFDEKLKNLLEEMIDYLVRRNK